MKDLPSPETLRKLLRYEPETGKLYWRERPREFFKTDIDCRRWNAKHSGKEAFTAQNVGGYLRGMIFRQVFFAHRVILALSMGEWPTGQIDHVNGDTSDNRIDNLRDVTPSENARNRRIRADSASGVNGVSWRKNRGKWTAYISHGGRLCYLGLFSDIQDAAAARKAAEFGHGFTDRHGK